jgi:hypothetical protein
MMGNCLLFIFSCWVGSVLVTNMVLSNGHHHQS